MGHKVFISYHHKFDQFKKDRLSEIINRSGNIDNSVDIGDINDSYMTTEEIYKKIRNEYLKDTSVTIVILNNCTKHRKHVDREIGSSLWHYPHYNTRNGLLILVTNEYNLSVSPIYGFHSALNLYESQRNNKFSQENCGQRLHDNIVNGYAVVGNFDEVINNPHRLNQLINEAYNNKNKLKPNNTAPFRSKNSFCYLCGDK